jgi:putative redox protein
VKLTVSYHGGSRYDITSGKHRVVTDQPVDNGGQDAGMSPVELFVSSLASCVGYFVGRYCDRHQISTKGLSVEAEWTMAEQPHRVGQIALAVHLAHRLTAEHNERLLKVAQGCTVHQSIAVPAGVSIELNPNHHGERPS